VGKATINRVCQGCNQTFKARVSDVKQGNGRFCSHPCFYTWYKSRSAQIERFWKKVDKSPEHDGCWIWKGSFYPGGYGIAWFDGTNRNAHRIAYIITNGAIPNNLLVCHNCPGGDNPACVNPTHMFLGTNKDNMQDAMHKGTHAAGKRHGMSIDPSRAQRGSARYNAKMSEETVRQVRSAYKNGISCAVLAAQHGMTVRSMFKVLSGQHWKHVTTEDNYV
jgi:hypothetical protein